MAKTFRLGIFLILSILIKTAPAVAGLCKVVVSETARQSESEWAERADKWDQTIGAGWNAVFRSLRLEPKSVVVEVAPGERTKVGYGLQGIGFSGTLYVVEPSRTSLALVVQRYKKILPEAQIIGIELPLDQALAKLPRNADALVSNHPLDDMVLSEYAADAKESKIFGEGESSESDNAVLNTWKQLIQSKADLENSQNRVVEQWKSVVTKLQPLSVVISQYESGFFQQIGFKAPDAIAFNVLNRLKTLLGPPDPQVLRKLNRHRLQPHRWLISQLRQKTSDKPQVLARLGENIFVQNWADPIEVNVNTYLYRSNSTPTPALKIGKNPQQGSIPVWVDKQGDPLEMALEGNLGSGRAAYVGLDRNLKGIGRTSLATSKSEFHNNGGLDLPNAIWEMLGSNLVYTNLRTSASPVTAIYQRGDTLEVGWTRKKLIAAVIERRDESGSLDRVSHLFATGRPLKREKILRMAAQFGRQDAEKFLERIIHGAWSAGNISTEGHMIDFDTVSAVKVRSPQYTLTGKWVGNLFGLEYKGQLELLESVVNHPINSEKVSYKEVERAFANARTDSINTRFADYMGVPAHLSEGFNFKNQALIAPLTKKFEKLSRLMYPNMSVMAKWIPGADQNSVFDFSKFMRFYPLWKQAGIRPSEMLARIQNEKKLEEHKSEYVSDDVVQYLDKNGILIRTQSQHDSALREALQFIQDYDALLSPMLANGNLADAIAANAYRVNEDRHYLSYGNNYQSIQYIVEALSSGSITPERFQKFMEILQIANDRLPIDSHDSTAMADVRVYREGWIGRRLTYQGTYQVVATRWNGEQTPPQNLKIKNNGEVINMNMQSKSTGTVYTSQLFKLKNLTDETSEIQIVGGQWTPL